MDYLNEIKKKYKPGEVILLKDLVDGMSDKERTRIRVYMARKVKSGEIKRAMRGVYYLPFTSILGNGKLHHRDIYVSKYMYKGDDVFGVFTGLTVENQLGFSSQVPAVPEILTNNTTCKKKMITYGKTRFIIYRSRIKITAENELEVQFMDFMYRVSTSSLKKYKKRLFQLIEQLGVDKQYIIKNLHFYPAKFYKKLAESEVLDELYKP